MRNSDSDFAEDCKKRFVSAAVCTMLCDLAHSEWIANELSSEDSFMQQVWGVESGGACDTSLFISRVRSRSAWCCCTRSVEGGLCEIYHDVWHQCQTFHQCCIISLVSINSVNKSAHLQSVCFLVVSWPEHIPDGKWKMLRSLTVPPPNRGRDHNMWKMWRTACIQSVTSLFK